jgi:hypothetical protein
MRALDCHGTRQRIELLSSLREARGKKETGDNSEQGAIKYFHHQRNTVTLAREPNSKSALFHAADYAFFSSLLASKPET